MKAIWYSINVWMATALYNLLDSLWIYNAHQFAPITPLDHGHFGNTTFSANFDLLFVLTLKLLVIIMLIGIFTSDTITFTSQAQLGVIPSQPRSLVSNINTTNQKGLINGWQETETSMYSCRYMNNHNYGTTLNPKKKKHEGRVGEAGQARADGNKSNWTVKPHVTWRPYEHLTPYSQLCVRKTFSAPFAPHPVDNHTYNCLASCVLSLKMRLFPHERVVVTHFWVELYTICTFQMTPFFDWVWVENSQKLSYLITVFKDQCQPFLAMHHIM